MTIVRRVVSFLFPRSDQNQPVTTGPRLVIRTNRDGGTSLFTNTPLQRELVSLDISQKDLPTMNRHYFFRGHQNTVLIVT